MSKQHDHFRLGLAVIVMFALFVACLLFIGGKGFWQPATRTLTVRLAAGPALPEISKGSLVTCFGQPVGKVTETGFVPAPDPVDSAGPEVQLLEVKAQVDAALDLRMDCVIAAAGPPLGGKGYLEIVNRGVARELLAADVPIYASATGLQTALAQLTEEFNARNPASLLSQIKMQLRPELEDSVIFKVHTSLDNIARMTASLASELDKREDDDLIAKVHAAIDKVNHSLAEVLEMVQDTRPRVNQIMTSAGHAMEQVDRDIVATLASELDRNKDASLLAQVHEAMLRLNQSLNNTNTITGEMERTVVLNSARIDQLVQNTTEASILLKRGIKDLALHPWKLFEKPNASRRRELENIDLAREFSDAAARLDDAAIRLKALTDAEGAALSANDPKLVQIQKDLHESVEAFFKAEAALFQRLGVE